MYIKIGLIVLTLLCAPIGASADEVTARNPAAVLDYLEQLVQWQRGATSLSPAISARDIIYQNSVEQNALKALRSGFKFARQQAAVHQPEETQTALETEATSPRQRMLLRMAENDKAIEALEQKRASRGLTKKERQNLEGSLKLAEAKKELFQTVVANMTAASEGSSQDLIGKINNLARELPELSAESKTTPSKPEAAALPVTSPTTARTTTSILSLLGDVFEATRKQRELKDFTKQTEQLRASSRSLLKELRVQLDALTGTDQSGVSVESQLASFKQLSVQIIPLGDSNLWINATQSILRDWQLSMEQHTHRLIRQLTLKIGVLLVMLAIPLALGEAARRAIARYVTDGKRKQIAQNARRTLVGIAVLFIVLMTFINDFSSFATFAGFLTAGLAVALQSVLLATVAHLFFYGRYGVRPGDRVKVNNVTGDIVQVGITRFYLRELEQGGEGLIPTGRIVAFPNSIIFQPSAFYKYVT